MTKREALRRWELSNRLESLGFSQDESAAPMRISRILTRWYALESGDGNDIASYAIERDEMTGKPYMVTHINRAPFKTYRRLVNDRERGAERRLARIMEGKAGLSAYLQTDPRGAALYIIRPGDVPEGMNVESCYSNGICVY